MFSRLLEILGREIVGKRLGMGIMIVGTVIDPDVLEIVENCRLQVWIHSFRRLIDPLEQVANFQCMTVVLLIGDCVAGYGGSIKVVDLHFLTQGELFKTRSIQPENEEVLLIFPQPFELPDDSFLPRLTIYD